MQTENQKAFIELYPDLDAFMAKVHDPDYWYDLVALFAEQGYHPSSVYYTFGNYGFNLFYTDDDGRGEFIYHGSNPEPDYWGEPEHWESIWEDTLRRYRYNVQFLDKPTVVIASETAAAAWADTMGFSAEDVRLVVSFLSEKATPKTEFCIRLLDTSSNPSSRYAYLPLLEGSPALQGWQIRRAQLYAEYRSDFEYEGLYPTTKGISAKFSAHFWSGVMGVDCG